MSHGREYVGPLVPSALAGTHPKREREGRRRRDGGREGGRKRERKREVEQGREGRERSVEEGCKRRGF